MACSCQRLQGVASVGGNRRRSGDYPVSAEQVHIQAPPRIGARTIHHTVFQAVTVVIYRSRQCDITVDDIIGKCGDTHF